MVRETAKLLGYPQMGMVVVTGMMDGINNAMEKIVFVLIEMVV